MRLFVWLISFVYFSALIVLAFINPILILPLLLGLPLILLAIHDALQNNHTILKNFPLLGRARYLFEKIRPEIHQYFVESNSDGKPFSREKRSLVYQRSKKVLDSLPFGTQMNVYEVGYEWLNHSINALHFDESIDLRTAIGEHTSATCLLYTSPSPRDRG